MSHYGDCYSQDKDEKRSELITDIKTFLDESTLSYKQLKIVEGLLLNESILDGCVGLFNLIKQLK